MTWQIPWLADWRGGVVVTPDDERPPAKGSQGGVAVQP
jgi:hypothetical protein